MMKLKIKLSLFNLLSKLVFASLFLLLMPYIIERINLRQVDNELIQKREKVISLIENIGIEPFITSDSSDTFGSFNILKEEFVSLERVSLKEDWNFIEVATRLIENEEIEYRVLNYSFRIDDQMYLLEVGKSLSSINKMARNTRTVMLVLLLLIIFITFLTDVQYTHLLLKPFDKITQKLKGISDPAIFDKTPVNTTTADFLQLDIALTEMMEHINQLFKKEKEITVNISHELLTPVSVLRSKLENLLLREDLAPDISIKVEESLKTLHRLQSLVNSLLLIARIESNQYLREDSFSLKEVLNEITDEIRPVADDAGITLKDETSQDLMIGKANRSLVFSMFYNVVNNAVKHSGATGEILIRSLTRDKKFIIEISDTGKGLTEKQMSTLFSRFKMRDESSAEGTGIGLAIAKSIADYHGIKISVESVPEEGTIFSFTIPENS
ncbi:MAG: HAMP domain-containing histidine kinase [Bacteroidales bacterium]|jgi:signal transduction histidine kinase|nr:HAMP domain-containing histidine kinase [Bacteroidales bacterium]